MRKVGRNKYNRALSGNGEKKYIPSPLFAARKRNGNDKTYLNKCTKSNNAQANLQDSHFSLAFPPFSNMSKSKIVLAAEEKKKKRLT